MKALILTEGGKNIGFGHLARCSSLYDAFREKGVFPNLIINCDKTVGKILKNRKYTAFNWLKEKNGVFNLVKGADIAIIDSYLAGASFYEKFSKIVKLPVYLDDAMRLDYPRGIVLNGSEDAEKLNYPKRAGLVYLLGKKYMPLRKEFWKVPKKKIKKNIRDVLLTFGNDDRANLTPQILKLLVAAYPTIHKRVVVGSGFKNIQEIKKVKDRMTKLVSYPDAISLQRLMLEADLAFSSGGQTICELARVGLPAIAIATAKNQLNNIMGMERSGLIKNAGWFKGKNLPARLSKGILQLKPYQRRLIMSKRQKRSIDGKGAQRVVNEILKKSAHYQYLKHGIKLRKVRQDDCYPLWCWRNNPQVRKWSFERNQIDYAKHKDWFKKKINNHDTRIYIAEDKQGRKIGQVRFEANQKSCACITINLNPKFFGKGFGREIMKMGTLRFLKEKPQIKEITAEIIRENIVSKKAFCRAGYVFLRNGFKNNIKMSVLIFKRKIK
ncbi:MAG: bifunctional UDP-2,4-diacetamido-2,4,6-trideoxy-beta-L-altropyranose hydrolase/GNAT family N-acetyltransferase [Candidatus Omnitrophica bacterium]|nr:bifunctional UDP-2,4-diacetamido-2,4,6-trideoxy-beta-L-altropyranose hydrolase/GNAT family N-acetyltransferase [Candidatus Omnitrophota bacterium]